MAIPEMKKAMSRLRLILAAIEGKDKELDSLRRQFQRQLDRAPNSAIHGDSSLDSLLSIMDEIQERLDDVIGTRRHLDAVKAQAQEELRALDLTEKIEHAKAQLAALKVDRDREGKWEEIAELERFIQEGSVRAGEAITGHLEDDSAE